MLADIQLHPETIPGLRATSLDAQMLSFLSKETADPLAASGPMSVAATAVIYTAPAPRELAAGVAGNSLTEMASVADKDTSRLSGQRPLQEVQFH